MSRIPALFRALACSLSACMTLVLALSAAAIAAPAPSPAGRWLTEDGAGVIEVAPCAGAMLCGRIVGVTLDHPSDPLPTDARGHPQCGLTIITDMRPSAPGVWQGHVTDPDTERTYDARMWLDPDAGLRLRGYVGLPLFGRTQDWRPFHGTIGRDCLMRGA